MNVCAFLLMYICCSGQAYVRILVGMHQDNICVSYPTRETGPLMELINNFQNSI